MKWPEENGYWAIGWVLFALLIALLSVFYGCPSQQENPQQEESAVVPQKEEGKGGEPARKKAYEPQFVELPEHLHYLRTATVRIRAGMVEGSGLVVRKEGEDTFILTLGYVVEDCRTEEKDGVRFHPAQIFFHQKDGEDQRGATILSYSGHENPALLRASYGKCIRPVAFGDGIDVLHVNTGPIAPGTTAGRTRPQQRKLGEIAYDQYYAEMGMAGSGGGGIFLKEDGKCLGLLSHGGGGITLAIPAAAIAQWARDHGVAWAIDHTVPVPSEEELKKLPIED